MNDIGNGKTSDSTKDRIGDILKVALVGSPNSGKTTIFNNLTGARQHVGNYPGVTVEKKTGERYFRGHKLYFIDLPGTYSLTAFSEEEVVTRNYILNDKPDVVVNIVDSSSLERNLYVTTQLIELGCKIVLVFNMADLLAKSGTRLNIELLSNLMGVPIVLATGTRNTGTNEILQKIIDVHGSGSTRKEVNIKYGDEIENEISRITKNIGNVDGKVQPDSSGYGYNKRWLAIKLLEQDSLVARELAEKNTGAPFNRVLEVSEKSIDHIKRITGDYPNTLIAEARYGFIKGALKEATISRASTDFSFSDRIDLVLINRIFGLPIFALIMWIIFQLVFKVGDYPTHWLQIGFNKLSAVLTAALPEGLLRSLLIDGIIGGVGGVLVFTPKIMILFICIAVLEDSGYMARAAFIMDRIMHRIGLHGKSFIPMLIGFGCTVPAYMCSRTLEDRNDRMITMHINTFMSCGGRLPIYILFAGAFFAGNAGNVIFSIYIIGILMAVAMAKLLRATRFKGESEPFVMELPIYRIPTFKGILMHMWERTWQYIKKAGTVILAISIIMWILFTFPKVGSSILREYDDKVSTVQENYTRGLIDQIQLDNELSKIKNDLSAKEISYSAAGRIGQFLEPVFKPLGFDWRLGLAAITGVAGKEVVVSTLGTTFSMSGKDNESESLRSALSEKYSPLTGYNFMLFCLLYFPCIASLAVFQKEAGTKEMLFQAGFTLALAWVISLIVYQVGRIFI
jgi:ferrous iron transport protein B